MQCWISFAVYFILIVAMSCEHDEGEVFLDVLCNTDGCDELISMESLLNNTISISDSDNSTAYYNGRVSFTVNNITDDTYVNSIDDFNMDVNSVYPSSQPTSSVTNLPTNMPTVIIPSSAPSHHPTACPSNQPTNRPSDVPTLIPSSLSTLQFSYIPSVFPTLGSSSHSPSEQPVSTAPTAEPSALLSLTVMPSVLPTISPSALPTSLPSIQSNEPSEYPTIEPSSTTDTDSSSRVPTNEPTSTSSTADNNAAPSKFPTTAPTTTLSLLSSTVAPSVAVSIATSTERPTSPSAIPTVLFESLSPTSITSLTPTTTPNSVSSSLCPTISTASPSQRPTVIPTATPTTMPSIYTSHPSYVPTAMDSAQPSLLGEPISTHPTAYPTDRTETVSPSVATTTVSPPSHMPSSTEKPMPTVNPSVRPSLYPYILITKQPSLQTNKPSSFRPSPQISTTTPTSTDTVINPLLTFQTKFTLSGFSALILINSDVAVQCLLYVIASVMKISVDSVTFLQFSSVDEGNKRALNLRYNADIQSTSSLDAYLLITIYALDTIERNATAENVFDLLASRLSVAYENDALSVLLQDKLLTSFNEYFVSSVAVTAMTVSAPNSILISPSIVPTQSPLSDSGKSSQSTKHWDSTIIVVIIVVVSIVMTMVCGSLYCTYCCNGGSSQESEAQDWRSPRRHSGNMMGATTTAVSRELPSNIVMASVYTTDEHAIQDVYTADLHRTVTTLNNVPTVPTNMPTNRVANTIQPNSTAVVPLVLKRSLVRDGRNLTLHPSVDDEHKKVNKSANKNECHNALK